MAKDDYEIIVYKILTYLYACLKRIKRFDQVEFDRAIVKNVSNENYLIDILRMMHSEGLIENIEFKKVWGNDYVLLTDLEDMEITAEGIRYLKDNSKSERVRKVLEESSDIIMGLLNLLQL